MIEFVLSPCFAYLCGDKYVLPFDRPLLEELLESVSDRFLVLVDKSGIDKPVASHHSGLNCWLDLWMIRLNLRELCDYERTSGLP